MDDDRGEDEDEKDGNEDDDADKDDDGSKLENDDDDDAVDGGDDDGDGDYGDGSLQCDVGVAGKRGPLQRPHGVRGHGNEPKTQTKMQMSQKHRARNSRNRN